MGNPIPIDRAAILLENLNAKTEGKEAEKVCEKEQKEEINQAVATSSSSDAFKAEKMELEIKMLSSQISKIEEEIKDRAQDRDERKRYADLTYSLVRHYLLVVLLIILFCGASIIKLSDNVILVLLGTLATNVLGIFFFVMRYLFRN